MRRDGFHRVGYQKKFQSFVDRNERSFYCLLMGKGEHTRQAILEQALGLASCIGIDGLSIGVLAERTGMSKSGLFAHFGSREEMQLAVLQEAELRFSEVVVRPALVRARGLSRLRALFENWLRWTNVLNLPGGCVLMAASHEFDDQPGRVHDALKAGQLVLRKTLFVAIGQAVEAGELDRDTPVEQFAFELVGIVLSALQSNQLLKDPATHDLALASFERLVKSYAVQLKKEAS